jgi:hypothetical protein
MTRSRQKPVAPLLAYQHRRFVQELHRRLTALEPLKEASSAAYRETILRTTSKQADAVIEANARRLRNKPEVKAELERLLQQATKITVLDAAWAMEQLRPLVEGVSIGNYLTPRQKGRHRQLSIDHCSARELAQLSELQIEESDDGRKVKVKLVDRIGALALMARIGGWEAPKKIAPTDTDGNDLNLLELVNASYELAEKRAAEAKAKESVA